MTDVAVRSRYTDEDVERGLQAIAIHGSSYKAEKALTEQGITISRSALDGWKITHAERYHEIRQSQITETRARLAAEYEDLALQAAEGSRLAVQATIKELKDGKNRNPQDAASKLAQTAGIMTDKANLLRGQATHRIELANASDILSELATKLPNANIIDSTATEIQ